ncbi:GNAT family N-acetyltransferase [Dokdonia sinensis]|uniref:GNAT family N-acetyltransferase n=1 Tax=Dokdonia sinensis TaxID=2479847 RepID=A0A3M0FW06_9FLAO|nr:GNAT family N-acetyltransferase [Dokdonia sinensis]RMB56147.1 GNAT family N-acetyltransferase [Dokdonia sinensis]
MDKPIIRPIEKADNAQVAQVIRKVLVDLGVPKVGTAYADKALDMMHETYDRDRATYFVVDDGGTIIGCAGIAQLDNYDGNVCELQKMYFLEEARGRGLGTAMMDACLEQARTYGFEQCYIETMPYMEAAQKLYKRTGFRYIDGPMGDTGHYSCPVHMLMDL